MESVIRAQRAGLYSLLHTAYTYPYQQEWLSLISELEVEPSSSHLAHLSAMQRWLAGDGCLTQAAERLNVEMTRLLEGPGVTPAPPYASYYLYRGQLMGPSAQAAKQVYLEWQVAPEGPANLPGDHIALELGFMAHLAQEASQPGSDDRALAASLTFLRQHLLPWLPAFCQALSGAAKETFFKDLAELTQQIVQADLTWLEGAVGEPNHLPASVRS